MTLEPIRLKCVTVGDCQVGKTCLLIRQCRDSYPEVYVPTVFDNYVHEITVNETIVEVLTEDARGLQQKDYARLRPLFYQQTDVFIICFDLSNPTSYENVQKLWYPEIDKHCPGTAYVLCGTKLDLREDEEGNPKPTDAETQIISYEQGQEMKSNIGALDYFECSALTGKGVNDAFHGACCQALSFNLYKKKKKKSCNVL